MYHKDTCSPRPAGSLLEAVDGLFLEKPQRITIGSELKRKPV